MPRESARRRGIQLIEMIIVLPMVGLVLTTVALSVAAIEATLTRVQEHSLQQSSGERFVQQLREDTHRALQSPTADAETLHLERLEGTVRYSASPEGVRRSLATAEGERRTTFAISASATPWSVDSERRVVRFTPEEGQPVAAAWSEAIVAQGDSP